MRAGGLALVAFLVALPASAQDGGARGAPITLDGVQVDGLAPAGDRRAGQRLQSARSIRIAVFRGRAPRSHGETETTVRVCGVDASRAEVAFAASAPVRVQIDSAEPSAHLVVPPRVGRTYVRVTIPRPHDGRERYVTVEWSVETARRDVLRAAEDAFFASIRCVETAD